MKCDFCGNEYDPADISGASGNEAKEISYLQYVCPSCGGEILTTDSNDMIGYCPFCAGASLVYSRECDGWNPDEIIPFKITQQQCVEMYQDQVKHSFFFYRKPKEIKPERFVGIYLPYDIYKVVQKGEYCVVTGDPDKRLSDSEHTEYHKVTGKINCCYEDIYHDASAAFDDRLSESIAPYDLKDAVPYVPGYLSGFYATGADAEPVDFTARIENQAKQRTIQDIRSNYYSACSKKNSASESLEDFINASKSTLPSKAELDKKALFPVWFLAVPEKNDKSYVAVNGQTGKASMDLPLSFAKIGLVVLALGLLISIPLLFLPVFSSFLSLGVSSLVAFITLLSTKVYFDKVTQNPQYQNIPGIKQMAKFPVGLAAFAGSFLFLGIIFSFTMLLVSSKAEAGTSSPFTSPGMGIVTVIFSLINIIVTFYFCTRYLRINRILSGIRPRFFDKKGV